MLSYLHSFHAGNHADILKHVTLLYVLEYLNKKEKPYSFFDTHAGSGLYDLMAENALKTGEARLGIERLLSEYKNNATEMPSALAPYLDFVKKSLENGFYPGSPAFEISFSKKGSFINLTELHRTEFESLKKNVERLKPSCSVNLLNDSGWNILKKNIPPAIKRGAILCDPSYEEKSDYTDAAELLSAAHKKWSAATVLLWYPLLANKSEEIENMKQSILSAAKNRDSHTEILDTRLLVDTEDSHTETTLEKSIGSEKPRLYGSGMFAVRPCWGLKEHLESVLPYLAELLGKEGNGSYKIELF